MSSLLTQKAQVGSFQDKVLSVPLYNFDIYV